MCYSDYYQFHNDVILFSEIRNKYDFLNDIYLLKYNTLDFEILNKIHKEIKTYIPVSTDLLI